jgi:hypothetical protein
LRVKDDADPPYDYDLVSSAGPVTSEPAADRDHIEPGQGPAPAEAVFEQSPDHEEPWDEWREELPPWETEELPAAGPVILGATRRVDLEARATPRPSARLEEVVEAEFEDWSAATGWGGAEPAGTAHAVPSPPEQSIEPEAPSAAGEFTSGPEAGGFAWTSPDSFVTDTTLGEPLEAAAAAPFVGVTSPSGGSAADARQASWAGWETKRGGESGRGLPTVGEILAAQAARSRPAGGTAPGRSRRPAPTVAHAPGAWSVPLWLGWAPTAVASVGLGLAGLAAGLVWSLDARHAGMVAARLADRDLDAKPLPEGVAPPGEGWWRSTATHLVEWAAYLDRGEDPRGAGEARELLRRASVASPLHPTARFALAHPLPGDPDEPTVAMARTLGQSRDVFALAWAGHQLRAAGKTAAAVSAYREALSMAERTDPARCGNLTFHDDLRVSRYGLPAEELIAGVIRDMAAAPSWTYAEWGQAVPMRSTSALVAARVLAESGSRDAAAALDAVVLAREGPEEGPVDGDPVGLEAVRVAARAEALALKRRWREADEEYRRAIELMPVDTVRRSWWFNVASIASEMSADGPRQAALDAAKTADPKDEITQRVVDAQKQARYVARSSGRRSDRDPAVTRASHR